MQRLEFFLVGHFAAAAYPIAQIDEGQARQFRLADRIEDHVGAQAAARRLRIVEAVDHRHTVAQNIGEHSRPQIALGVAVFGDMGALGAILDHHHVFAEGHSRHIAIMMTAVEITIEQFILLQRCRDIVGRDAQITVARQGFSPAPLPVEMSDINARGAAGIAFLAGGAVEHGLAAAKSGMGEGVIERRAFAQFDAREDLALHTVRQIGAGTRRGQEKRNLLGGKRVGHVLALG